MFPAKVPPRLLPVVTMAQALKPADGPDVLEEKARALKHALTELNTNMEPSDAEPADAGRGDAEHFDRLAESRAEKQMPEKELAAYNAWRQGVFQPVPVVNWDHVKSTDESRRKTAKEFPAGPGDLCTLYKTSGLKLPHLAAWLAVPALATEEACEVLKAIGRVRRVRMRAAKAQSSTGGVPALGVRSGSMKPKGQQKDIRVLRGVLKSVRVVKNDLQSRLQKALKALKDVENETQGKLRVMGADGGRNRGGPGGRHRRGGNVRYGGGIVPPAGVGEKDVVAELGESAVRPVSVADVHDDDKMHV